MGQAGSSLVVSMEMLEKGIEAGRGNGRLRIGKTYQSYSTMFFNPNLCTKDTQPITNMESRSGGLEDGFAFQTGDFQVLC